MKTPNRNGQTRKEKAKDKRTEREKKEMRRGQKVRERGEKKGSRMVIFYNQQQACGLAGTTGVSLLESGFFFTRGCPT